MQTFVIILHSCGCILHHAIGSVRIHIQGKGSGRMTEHFLDRLDVRSGRNGNRGSGMPEIMRTGIRAANRGGDLLEVLVIGPDRRRKSNFISKDKIFIIQPGFPSAEPGFFLFQLLVLQISDCDLRQVYGPWPAGFGRRDHDEAFFSALQLLVDQKGPFFEIDLTPG